MSIMDKNNIVVKCVAGEEYEAQIRAEVEAHLQYLEEVEKGIRKPEEYPTVTVEVVPSDKAFVKKIDKNFVKLHREITGDKEETKIQAEINAHFKHLEKLARDARKEEEKLHSKATEDAILPEESVEKKEEIAERIREKIPNMRKEARAEVAEMLFNMCFDEVEALNETKLKKISGIGDKYAEEILSNRWYFADKLIFADQYTIAEKAKIERIRQREVMFNRNYDPHKEGSLPIEAKDVATGAGEVHRMLKRKGYEPYDVLITVIGLIDQNARPAGRAEYQKALWHKWTHVGFKARGGKVFKPLYHGTNGGRYGKVIFVREDVFAIVREFLRNGARDVVKSTEAKEAAYMGLLNPGTMSWETYYGFKLKPERVAIVKGWEKVFPNQFVDFVDVKTGTVTLKAERSVKENEFDGQYLVDPSAATLAAMSKDQKRTYRHAGDATGRAPYWKGLGIKVYFHAALRDMGVTWVETVNNGRMRIEDIDVIADESVMKAKFGEGGHFANWSQYCENFDRLEQQFCVLITEHEDKLHNLPNQQMQAMVGADEKDLKELIENEIEYLMRFANKDKAARLLGGEMAQIVRAVPGLHLHPWVQERIQAAYRKLYNQAKAASLHNMAHYVFFGKDPSAQLQHVAWACSNKSPELQRLYPNEADYAVGCIPADTIICRVAKDTEKEGVLSRNPSTDAQAQVVVKVEKTFGDWDKYIPYSTTAFVSIMSYIATRVRGDHDGDHIFLSFIKSLIKMAKAANEFTGGRLIDWIPPETTKHVITLESMFDYFDGLTEQSQLGHFCDLLTSLIGYGVAEYDHKTACWLVMAVNVFVDAAKHGKGSVKVPDFVLDALSVKDLNGKVVKNGNIRVMRAMPVYAMQGKDNQHPTRTEKRINSDRCSKELGTGNGDLIYREISENVDETLSIDLSEVEKFNINELLYDFDGQRNGGKSYGLRGCNELFDRGTYNSETGKFEGQGLWLELCYERTATLKSVAEEAADADDDKFAYNQIRRNIEYLRRYMAIKRLDNWAAEHGKMLEDVYDAITFWTWKKLIAPVQGENESDADYNKRKIRFDIMIDGWTKMLGGLALRAVHQRAGWETVCGMTVADADGFDLDDSFMDDLA